MFQRTLKTEIRKALWNKKMLAAMALVFGIVAVHCVMTVHDYRGVLCLLPGSTAMRI